MKIIESSVKEIIQEPGLEGIYKQVAYGGHICYLSDKVGGEKEFVDRLISMKHYSPLSHGTVYLTFVADLRFTNEKIDFWKNNHWSKINTVPDGLSCVRCFVTTNYRVLVENNMLDMLQFATEPTEQHEKRRTFHVICSIGISREMNRHTTLCISESSTRYCNFSKDRFGNEVTFIKPYWIPSCNPTGSGVNQDHRIWFNFCNHVEYKYLQLIDKGFKPQEAREVLPLCTKTEVIYTAFESDWRHFLDLRCDSKAHPDAQLVANMIKELM